MRICFLPQVFMYLIISKQIHVSMHLENAFLTKLCWMFRREHGPIWCSRNSNIVCSHVKVSMGALYFMVRLISHNIFGIFSWNMWTCAFGLINYWRVFFFFIIISHYIKTFPNDVCFPKYVVKNMTLFLFLLILEVSI